MALTRPKIWDIDTNTIFFNDPITVLHQGATSANVDVGFLFNRANGLVSNVALYWSESGNTIVTAFTSNSGSTDSNISASGYANLTIGSLLTVNGAGVYLSTGAGINVNGSTGSVGQVLTASGTGGVQWAAQGGFSGGVVPNQLIANSGATSTSTTTGAFLVTGGSGVTGNLYVGGNVVVTSTGYVQVPSGTSAQRPVSASLGMIRYNSTISSFEGFGAGNAWSSLGGVKSVDGYATITAEASAGAGDDVLRFYSGSTGSSQQVMWASTGNVSILTNLYVTGNTTRSNRVLVTNYSGNTAPSTPLQGDEWFRGNTGVMYKYLYDNVSSTFNWVDMTSALYNANTAAVANTIALRDSGGNITATYFLGRATSASYADLAEIYTPDAMYEPATVVVFGGDEEITVTTKSHDARVAGVVSTNPAYLMNKDAEGIPVAFTGRVPCLVQGPVHKGQLLVTSTTPGVAEALDNDKFVPGCVIGKSLENLNTTTISTIEVVVGRF